MMKSFLICEPNPIARIGIHSMIVKNDPFAFIKEVTDEISAADYLAARSYDAIILGSFRGVNSIRFCKKIRRQYPSLSVILLASKQNNSAAVQYVKTGVRGYINIDEEANERVAEAIAYVMKGYTYISTSVDPGHSANRQADDNPFYSLSKRETQVIQQLFLGKKMVQIADHLSISQTTVSTYKTRLFHKLNIPDQNIVKLLSMAQKYHVI